MVGLTQASEDSGSLAKHQPVHKDLLLRSQCWWGYRESENHRWQVVKQIAFIFVIGLSTSTTETQYQILCVSLSVSDVENCFLWGYCHSIEREPWVNKNIVEKPCSKARNKNGEKDLVSPFAHELNSPTFQEILDNSLNCHSMLCHQPCVSLYLYSLLVIMTFTQDLRSAVSYTFQWHCAVKCSHPSLLSVYTMGKD